MAACVPARLRDACGHGLTGAGVVAQGLDERYQFRGLEEDEAAVPEVIGQAAELLAPDRDLRVFLVGPARVQPGHHAGTPSFAQQTPHLPTMEVASTGRP